MTTKCFKIFHFKTKDDVYSVLEKWSWMLGGKVIVLQQWNPHFVFDMNIIKRLAV